MILTKEINTKIIPKNFKSLNKNHPEIKIGDDLVIKLEELSFGSSKRILVKCDNCGTEKEITYYDYNKITDKQTTSYFCKKCKFIKIKKTNLEKYGVENVFQLESTKEKKKKTNLEKYGVEHHLQNKEILNKQQETNLEKYGVKFQTQRTEVIEKQQQTNLEKYGVKFTLNNEEINKKSKKTLLERYNVDNPMKNEDIKLKAQNKKKEKIINKYKDYNLLEINKNNYTMKCEKNHIYDISSELFRNRIIQKTIICTKCNPIDNLTSGLEIELQEFIQINSSNIQYNKRDIIPPYELDIYLPDLNLAFEFNGVYWHNELFKNDNYHSNKSDLCDKKGIQLIHIWEDDWIYKKDIIKSIILNKLNKTSNKIYSRKCEIKEIKDNNITRDFLNKNHIQGFVGSEVKIGLFYKNELISLMTFGKSRKPMCGNKEEWEIIRLCNKLNYLVIGGTEKMFKYFINNYYIKKLITYADRSYFNGKNYEKLGFNFDSKISSNYYYVVNGIRKYRYNYRKDILVKEGFDIKKSEHEIMLERNIYRIYDSGNIKYILII